MNLKSKLGIGTVQFGLTYGISNKQGQTLPEEVERILSFAFDNSIDLIDTASTYGNAEMLLGKNDIGRFDIVSKFMPPEKNNSIRAQLHRSLKELKVNSLYGYLAHRPLVLIDKPQLWEELCDLKKSGLIKKIGFSLNTPSELEDLLRIGFFPDLVQVPFNYFDSRFKKQIIQLKERGCEIHARSVFLQGLFFTNPDKLTSFFSELKEFLISLQQSTKYLSSSLLKFVLKYTFIDRVIIGVETSEQLRLSIEMLEKADDLPDIEFSLSENVLMPSRWPQNPLL